VSSGRSRDSLPLTPPSYVTDLHLTIQQPHCTMFTSTHLIQEINEDFSIPPASNEQYQPLASACPPCPYIPYQGSCLQSTPTSSPSFETLPNIHSENPWGVPPSQLPSSTLLDPGPILPGWNASCFHPQPEEASRSRFPQSCTVELMPAAADTCYPRGDSWWPLDNTSTYPGRFFHRTHHSQIFDSTSLNYLTSHSSQGLSDSELLYPPLLPGLLSVSLV
jgi:hypothetical protein